MTESSDNSARDAQMVAELTADVDVRRIAVVYAQALFAAAEDAGLTETAQADLDALLTEVLDPHREFENLLGSAMVSIVDKETIIDRTCGGVLAPMTINFLKVVARHERLDCLRAIAQQYNDILNEKAGFVTVTVTTAMPIDSTTASGQAVAERLREKLKALLGGKPKLIFQTDPELIGGAVVRVGDTVYDGSIQGQLERIREQIIDRSAHEIQSRRNRFRDPAGN